MTFEEFATARLPSVLRFAGVLTGDRGLAEDVVQEVLIRANARWQAIARLDQPEAYVRKMIVNEYLSWRRRSWRLVLSGAGTDLHSRPSPDHAAGYAERDAIWAELAKLPLRQRAVLGQWRVTGRTTISGQPAVKLTETKTGVYQPLPTVLWVNARTHLPIRMNNGTGPIWGRIDWHYLKPAPANMALLRVPVPPGYHRSG